MDPVKREFSEWPCSVARSAEIFGDSWTILIVRDAVQGLTRFDEFQRSLNVARNTLSDRLGKLVDAGVMTKRFYQDNPPRYEYILTEMGKDFFPVLAVMRAWGDKWLDGGEGAPVTLHHYRSGHELLTEVICADCGEAVVHDDVQFCVGPGYPEDVRPEVDIRGRLAEVPGGPGGIPGGGIVPAVPVEAVKATRTKKSVPAARIRANKSGPRAKSA